MTLGLVLSGGGARGAYEAGVLSALFDPLATRAGRTPRFDVLSATSVGALHAAALASMADQPREAARLLHDVWGSLAIGDVFSFGVRGALRLTQLLRGSSRNLGLFDGAPLLGLARQLPLAHIGEHLRARRLRALTVSATHIGSGRSVVFATSGGAVPSPPAWRRITYRESVIRAEHIAASDSIPVLFPPVDIDGDLYCDGGLRLNTPLAPAIHFGADRILIVALSSATDEVAHAPGTTPSLPFLMGKVLNAFLLDHVMTDLAHLRETNRLLQDGARAFGPDFLPQMSARAVARGESPRRIVETLVVRPSRDIGLLAAEHLRARAGRLFDSPWLRLLDVEPGGAADLASYLLFDAELTRELLELGRSDALAMGDELESFLHAREPAGIAAIA